MQHGSNKRVRFMQDVVIEAEPDAERIATREQPQRLSPGQMPRDFAISLSTYRRGGTGAFLERSPSHVARQRMRGFESQYVNIIDYIVRITHRIWEERDIGYIYDTYSHDANVWDDYGLQYGRDKIVADTLHTTNAFSDIRLIADEVIWAGDDLSGFHTSHRTVILGTNTGWSRYGPPTGKRVRLWCVANCVARDNEIFHEHVLYNTSSMLRQLGFDLFEIARTMKRRGAVAAFPDDFAASEPARLRGQAKPALLAFPTARFDVAGFVAAFFQNVWNRRMLSDIDRVCAPHVVLHGPTDRIYHGSGQYKAFVLSILAAFPDLSLTVEDLYWMGNPDEGLLVSIRWEAQGAHTGYGLYGDPTGRPVRLWGITQWSIRNGQIEADWTMFNELGLLMQLVDA